MRFASISTAFNSQVAPWPDLEILVSDFEILRFGLYLAQSSSISVISVPHSMSVGTNSTMPKLCQFIPFPTSVMIPNNPSYIMLSIVFYYFMYLVSKGILGGINPIDNGSNLGARRSVRDGRI